MQYLSHLIGAPVKVTGKTVAHIVDLRVELAEPNPRIVGFEINPVTGGPVGHLALAQAVKIAGSAGIEVNDIADVKPLPVDDKQMLLAQDILDKQIVDIEDCRVVRANDLEIQFSGGDAKVMAIDVGMRSLVRRLGWLEGPINAVANFVKRPLTEQQLPWDLLEPLPTAARMRLKVPSKKLAEMHPADLADIIEDLSVTEAARLVSTLDDEHAAETLGELDEPEDQVNLVEHLSTEKAADILEEMPPDEAADILQDLQETKPEKVEEILQDMDREEADDVRELLAYDEHTAGGLMTTEYIDVDVNTTVRGALQQLRLLAPDAEIIYYLYVIDAHHHLKGVVSIRDILVTNEDEPITSIMDDDLIAVTPEVPQEEVASLISKYNLLALPVVDAKGEMLGVVTVDDVIELMMDHLPRFWKRATRAN